ncbi:MAG: winged helix-turn-helix domain-containing protein [Actinobacteria bacterium]|nr:winged helix-turn-helix domain-containing protein [Actinomycetota bacterium]
MRWMRAPEAARLVHGGNTEELLEIHLLGPFEALVDGTAADVGGSKRQALLAVLALRPGRVVDVDTLVDALWGEELPAAPRNALHHHVARLRAALGEHALTGSVDGYALAHARVDAADFEELLAETRHAQRDGDVAAAAEAIGSALALWRGQALQGLATTTWLSAEARRLETLRADALEEQFEVSLALGEHRELVSAIQSALAANPFRERLWGQLMLALYRSGRQADALETFQEARRVLADELGLEPGPDLRRLQEAILAHDPAIAAVPADRGGRGNLPAHATSFVGRDDELAQVVALVDEHRLVTLTGPPGVGKSRLAVEAARALEPGFPEGLWLVEFGRANTPADAVRLLANALGVRGADPLARVASRLRNARALLVLDACERVLVEAARIASTLLTACPFVRVLATSREALHADGEVRLPVAPLADGGALFLERARAARPGFLADADAAAAAAEIARRVDGLPLGIELAAARANVLGFEEIVSILGQRASLLRDGAAEDPSRSALRALVDWSYDLLHADEKTIVQQLAVHRGGASLASLSATVARYGLSEATVTYLLSALVEKSIVSPSFSGGGARYEMLDTVREYVLDELGESGGLAGARLAHAEYFARLADDARGGLRGPGWLTWERRLEAENDNFWAAVIYANETGDAEIANRLGSLGWYFALAERITEGRRFLELARSAAGEGASVELLALLCYLASEELDLDTACAVGERALALSGDASPHDQALARLTLALAVAQTGERERADALAEDAFVAFSTLGDHWGAAASSLIHALGAAHAGDVATVAAMAARTLRHADAIEYDAFRLPALIVEAWVAERRGDGAAAVETYAHALDLAGRVGFGDHAAFVLSALGQNALARGDVAAAEELQRQALATASAADTSWVAAYARTQLAVIAAANGDADTAESLRRDVLEWTRAARPRRARESLFVALVGDPAAALPPAPAPV